MEKIKSNNLLRCPNCGGSDIRFDVESGKLKCTHCRLLIEGVRSNEADDVSALTGKIISGGAKKIIDDKTMVTLKCSACGAKVIVNTDEATSARCPWCRHILSITDKLPNGAVPDLILPFKVPHKDAVQLISKYIKKHRSIAESGFVHEFCDSAVMGVYLPYMVIDMNVHAKMSGEGEVETRRYVVGSGDDKETRYDADVYEVSREFDVAIDDLTIEASSDRLNQDTLINTNNVINAIMPFDTQNAMEWDPRYVRGFSCERRDVDVEDLDRRVKLQVEDVMKFRMRNIISEYRRGVHWDKMRLEQRGVKWKTAYLPVWLYSYLDENRNGKNVLHYVAVNGRSEEVVGSTPINWTRVMSMIAILPSIAFLYDIALGCLALRGVYNSVFMTIGIVLSSVAFLWIPTWAVAMGIKTHESRNRDARHMHERDTRAEISNVERSDSFKSSLHGLTHSMMLNRNDNTIKGVLRNEGGKSIKFGELGRTLLGIVATMAAMCIMVAGIMFSTSTYYDAVSRDHAKTYQEVRKKRNNYPQYQVKRY